MADLAALGSDYNLVRAMLQGGASNVPNYNPVSLQYSPGAPPTNYDVPAQTPPQASGGELAALDSDSEAPAPQAPASPMVQETPQAGPPLTVEDFIRSQMAALGDTSELEKKSQQEERNSEEILAKLNAGSEQTPFLTQLLTGAAALIPALINKGSGAEAGLKSYELGQKALEEDEKTKRALLTDRFKISQGKIDRYDNKAASLAQQKTGLVGTMLNAQENREARAEEAKFRREEMALRRQEMSVNAAMNRNLARERLDEVIRHNQEMEKLGAEKSPTRDLSPDAAELFKEQWKQTYGKDFAGTPTVLDLKSFQADLNLKDKIQRTGIRANRAVNAYEEQTLKQQKLQGELTVPGAFPLPGKMPDTDSAKEAKALKADFDQAMTALSNLNKILVQNGGQHNFTGKQQAVANSFAYQALMAMNRMYKQGAAFTAPEMKIDWQQIGALPEENFREYAKQYFLDTNYPLDRLRATMQGTTQGFANKITDGWGYIVPGTWKYVDDGIKQRLKNTHGDDNYLVSETLGTLGIKGLDLLKSQKDVSYQPVPLSGIEFERPSVGK